MDFPLFGPDRAFGSNLGRSLSRSETQTPLVKSGGPSYTPGSGEHGPRFLTDGPGAAPGGVASKNGWVYMRVQGGFNFP